MRRKIHSDKICYSMWRYLNVHMSVCDRPEQFGYMRYVWLFSGGKFALVRFSLQFCEYFSFSCHRCAVHHEKTKIVRNGNFHWIKYAYFIYLYLCVNVKLYSQICILSCVCYLLWHVTPSTDNIYPLWHAQYQEPSVLIHSCSQPPVSLSHSFLSVYRYRICNIIQSILF